MSALAAFSHTLRSHQLELTRDQTTVF
ncbi:hypothetical protein DFAR_1240009 [Desulfarculales bacterium]